jgi:hypothetical protein
VTPERNGWHVTRTRLVGPVEAALDRVPLQGGE